MLLSLTILSAFGLSADRTFATLADKPVRWSATSTRPAAELLQCITDNMPVRIATKTDGDRVVIGVFGGEQMLTTYTVVPTATGSLVERRGKPFIRKPVDQCLASPSPA